MRLKRAPRFPIIAKTKDDILGYVTLQNLIKEYLTAPGQEIKKIMQEPIIFIDTIPVKLLLSEMQKSINILLFYWTSMVGQVDL